MSANTIFTQMENKQHSTDILPKTSFINEYSEFIVDATEKTGDYIVENALDEMTAQGVNTSILTDGEVPSIAEVSFNKRRSENYIYKVREDELKKASGSKEAYAELEAKINGNLDQQDIKNCWRSFPKLLLKDSANFKTDMVNYSENATAYATNIEKMMNDIDLISMPSDKYNVYSKTVGSTTYSVKTYADEPIIIMRKDYYNKLKAQFTAGVYNLKEIELKAKIITVPTFYLADGSTEDSTILWITCDRKFPRIYKDFEKRARLEDVRSFNIGKAVTYIEYTSKFMPCIVHSTYTPEA